MVTLLRVIACQRGSQACQIVDETQCAAMQAHGRGVWRYDGAGHPRER